MGNLSKLMADTLTGYDFLVAGLIVLFVEYVIKPLFKKTSEKTQTIVVKVAPVVIGAIIYLVLALIQKTTWHQGLIHGVVVGLTAMGSYDLVLDTIKKSGKKSIDDVNTAVKEVIEGDK